jgi:hypothetical protein
MLAEYPQPKCLLLSEWVMSNLKKTQVLQYHTNVMCKLKLKCRTFLSLYLFLEVFHNVGMKEEGECPPTYVYPEQVKTLIRSVFPEDICDYPDPCHQQVIPLHTLPI